MIEGSNNSAPPVPASPSAPTADVHARGKPSESSVRDFEALLSEPGVDDTEAETALARPPVRQQRSPFDQGPQAKSDQRGESAAGQKDTTTNRGDTQAKTNPSPSNPSPNAAQQHAQSSGTQNAGQDAGAASSQGNQSATGQSASQGSNGATQQGTQGAAGQNPGQGANGATQQGTQGAASPNVSQNTSAAAQQRAAQATAGDPSVPATKVPGSSKGNANTVEEPGVQITDQTADVVQSADEAAAGKTQGGVASPQPQGVVNQAGIPTPDRAEDVAKLATEFYKQLGTRDLSAIRDKGALQFKLGGEAFPGTSVKVQVEAGVTVVALQSTDPETQQFLRDAQAALNRELGEGVAVRVQEREGQSGQQQEQQEQTESEDGNE